MKNIKARISFDRYGGTYTLFFEKYPRIYAERYDDMITSWEIQPRDFRFSESKENKWWDSFLKKNKTSFKGIQEYPLKPVIVPEKLLNQLGLKLVDY